MSNTDKTICKGKSQKERAVRDNRMVFMFEMMKRIGYVIKVRHIDHMTITGVLYSIKPSLPQNL